MTCVAVIVGLLLAGGVYAFVTQKALAKAKAEYESALAALTSNSESSHHRIAALDAGRRYADLARRLAGQKGIAVFDEVKLQNDILVRTGRR
jgi:multidrug efflux pump subunit AcrA (membrane-fusion protein)